MNSRGKLKEAYKAVQDETVRKELLHWFRRVKPSIKTKVAQLADELYKARKNKEVSYNTTLYIAAWLVKNEEVP